MDCLVKILENEAEIPIQFTTSHDLARKHRKKHPEIPIVRTRKETGLTKTVEEIERDIIERLITHRADMVFSELGIQAHRFYAKRYLFASVSFEAVGLKGVIRLYFFHNRFAKTPFSQNGDVGKARLSKAKSNRLQASPLKNGKAVESLEEKTPLFQSGEAYKEVDREERNKLKRRGHLCFFMADSRPWKPLSEIELEVQNRLKRRGFFPVANPS